MKCTNFSLTQKLEIIVNSIDMFQQPEEQKLQQLLQVLSYFIYNNTNVTKQINASIQFIHKIFIIKLYNKQDKNHQAKLNISHFNIIPDMAFRAIKPINYKLKVKQGQIIQYTDKDIVRDIQDYLPEDIQNKLYKFQKEGIEFGIKNFGRVLIGDEMGVGKTVQALALAYVYNDQWPLLIICPALLMLNWKDEIQRWLHEAKDLEIQILQKQKDQIQLTSKIIITSYDLAVHHADCLQQLKIKVAIADEAHHLKSAQSKRSQVLLPFLKQMRHVILLTGTPALAKPKEIFNLISIIRPDVFQNFIEFGNRYCDPRVSRFKKGFDYEGCTNPIELYTIITKYIMIRRLKKDVLEQLPNKIKQNIKIKVNIKILNQIQAIISKNEAQIEGALNGDSSYQQNNTQTPLEENNQIKTHSTLALIQKCYKLTGQAKIDGICEFLEEIIDSDSDEKFIVFAHHIEVLDDIQVTLTKLNINIMRIDGSVSQIQRHQCVQDFQCKPQVKVALLSLTSASIGLTLTAASTVIFAEMHWTPGIMKQAEDRAHRIGQKNCVNCIYLIGERTLDDKIITILDRKNNTLDYILDGGQKIKHYNEEITQFQQSSLLQTQQRSDQNNLYQKQTQQGTLLNFFKPKQQSIPAKKNELLAEVNQFIDDMKKEEQQQQIHPSQQIHSIKLFNNNNNQQRPSIYGNTLFNSQFVVSNKKAESEQNIQQSQRKSIYGDYLHNSKFIITPSSNKTQEDINIEIQNEMSHNDQMEQQTQIFQESLIQYEQQFNQIKQVNQIESNLDQSSVIKNSVIKKQSTSNNKIVIQPEEIYILDDQFVKLEQKVNVNQNNQFYDNTVEKIDQQFQTQSKSKSECFSEKQRIMEEFNASFDEKDIPPQFRTQRKKQS